MICNYYLLFLYLHKINYMYMKIENLIVTGIYTLKNKITKENYIGKSSNIYMRLGMHLTRLCNNKHRNRLLQASWNKYGVDNFELEVLEICSLQELDVKEMSWINKLADFNITRDGYRLSMTDESKKKMSETRKRKFENKELIPYQYKEVHKYDMNGTYIESYGSILEAARLNNTLSCTIVRACKTNKSSNNFMWSYLKEIKIPAYKRNYKNKDLVKSDKLLENPEEDNQQPTTTLNE